MSHVKSRPLAAELHETNTPYGVDEFGRSRRVVRNKRNGIDQASLATVRELLKEIRRLEEEVRSVCSVFYFFVQVDHLSVDNEDLLSRMEDLLEENESLRRQCHSRSCVSSFPDGRYKATPKSSFRRTWEELDDRESLHATSRFRGLGQRSIAPRRVVVEEDQSDGSDERPIAVGASRKVSDSTNVSVAARKSSSGCQVAFGGVDQSVAVPAAGSMRPSRSRVSTPHVSGEAVDRLTFGAPQLAHDSEDETRQSMVNFEQNVHVVQVPVTADDPHIRSIRGRIATPFMKDVPPNEEASR